MARKAVEFCGGSAGVLPVYQPPTLSYHVRVHGQDTNSDTNMDERRGHLVTRERGRGAVRGLGSPGVFGFTAVAAMGYVASLGPFDT